MHTAGYFAFMDFVLALFPILLLQGLQISTGRKFALSCLLGLGVL